jgi:hypothetical protein
MKVYVISTFLQAGAPGRDSTHRRRPGLRRRHRRRPRFLSERSAQHIPVSERLGRRRALPRSAGQYRATTSITLKFLTAIYLLLARPPAIVAKSVATATILSNYRL